MINPLELTGKHILIVGATSGIGKATAELCRELGAKLTLVGRNEDKLNQLHAEFGPQDNSIYKCDVADLKNFDSILDSAVKNGGPLNGYVYSAGVELTRPFKMLTEEHWLKTFRTNVFAGFEIARLISKREYVGSDASMVFVSSIVGIVGQAGKTVYSASKGAIVAGCKCLALELAPRNIRINSVLPAIVETELSTKMLASLDETSRNRVKEMHPLGFGKPRDVAHACAFLLAPTSRWITGSSLVIDGGYSAA
jgi:NAD(P)-dependent dehydrogenase (short-subunit alcohol dehydrogenase family)